MTDSKNGAIEPGVYVKGDVARRAATPSEAARYVWDGFVRQEDEAPAKSEESDQRSETEKEADKNAADARAEAAKTARGRKPGNTGEEAK